MRILPLLVLALLVLSFGCQGTHDEGHKIMDAYAHEECHDIWPLSEELLNRIKNNANLLYYKGLCEHQMGHHLQAISDLKLVLASGGKFKYGVYLNLASSYAALGERNSAFENLELLVVNGFKNDKLLDRSSYNEIRSDPRFVSLREKMTPSYDIWTSMFLFVALQGLFVSIFFFWKKIGSEGSSHLLAFLLLLFSITIFSFTLYWTGYHFRYPYLNHYYHLLPYFAGPLFYLYMRNLVSSEKLKWTDIAHFLPALVALGCLIPWIASNYWDIRLMPLAHSLSNVASNSVIKILLLGFHTLLAYRLVESIPIEEKQLRQKLKFLVYAFGGYVVSMLSYYILKEFSFFSSSWDYAISFMISFFIFLVSIIAYSQPRWHEKTLLNKSVPNIKYKKTGMTEQAELSLKRMIEMLMTDELLYTNETLRLDDLAEQVGASRHNVSMIINKHFHENFFDFLNKYRVEYVKEKMFDPLYSNHTLIELAYESGFNNKVSFNKAFKKFTGRTPSAYKKSVATNLVK